ncbi:MAG: hypothetical protein HUU38_10480 [Anaerolineales bacterium]|nr:hypothetical protein [Anaerolineales bacterium]
MPQTLSLIADIIGITGAIFALFAWLQARQLKKIQEIEQIRQNKKIKVVLNYGLEKIELPIELRRAEFNRAEILGRIGMIPMKDKEQKRFKLEYLHSVQFYQQVTQLMDGVNEGLLTIPCSKEEFYQFDLSKANQP